ncbi:MAG: DUF1365 domain-containing protein [Marinobacter sp.]|uniref:DUF1365 domain-containing protein n=1 Tax=Marinobacter sp. TaxID=50741 RepID=UPI00299E8701|nr:DUF1365 domain-containing protein [Marinobacter sp.]MDX1755014.1 DUF1365 domain-containing protein [Marinobacter sp.]
MSKPSEFASDWLEGTVRHRRHTPVAHQFCYSTGMLALDLSEWQRVSDISPWFSLERFNWVALYRGDYLAPGGASLQSEVTVWVETQTGWRPDGPIQLITHPRYFGYVFNPVSFYFCYNRGEAPSSGAVPKVILAHITNTPWNERHLYCLECSGERTGQHGWQTVQFEFDKRFHVSPFNDMAQRYRWLFSFRGSELRIHMDVHAGKKVFDATLEVQRAPLCRNTFHRSLRRFPLECIKVVSGIYWQALRLKLKGARFHPHPGTLPDNSAQHGQGRNDRGMPLAQAENHSSLTGRVRSWRT